jgi:hypothetical protein
VITVLALAAQLAASVPDVVRGARVDPKLGVNFAAAIVPETVTVGQQALYQVAVFVSDEVRQRLRRNPEFVPPELRAVLAYDPPGSYTRYERVRLAGRDWEAHVFQRVIFPLASGRVEIPPARLSYALPLSSSFFSREETYTVRSPAVRLEAIDPPTSGRPSDWNGAVGRVTMTARVSPRVVRAGDPVTVTLGVRGSGNVNLWPRPALDVPWGDAVPAGERVTLDSVRLRVEGTKEFEWIVTPRRAGAQVLAVQRYPVYDATEGRYTVAFTTPESLEVRTGAAVAGAGAPAANASDAEAWLSVRTVWHGEQGPPPWQQWAFWLVVAVAPAAAAWRWRRSNAARIKTRGDAGGSLPGPDVGRGTRGAEASPATPAGAYEAWHAGLRALVAVPLGADAHTLERALRRAGITEDTAARALELERTLAMRAYGGAARAPAVDSGRVSDILRRVEKERATVAPRITGRGRAKGWLAMLATGAVAGAVAGAAVAAAPDAAATRFAAGVQAYGARDTVQARRAFADAARLAPRAVDAWANLGTAAWVMQDTGVAAMAWQRALRLDPSAADVRTRVEALPGMRAAVLASETVWPVSAAVLAWVAALAWSAAWAALAVWPAARGASLAVGGCAVVIAGVAAVANVRQQANALVVVASGDRLRTVPALGADPIAAVSAGEVATVHATRDGWSQVVFGDGREGWLEGRRLLGLAQPQPRPPSR